MSVELMFLILVHILDEDGTSPYGIPQDELDKTLDQAAEAIPAVVPAIFKLLAQSTSH